MTNSPRPSPTSKAQPRWATRRRLERPTWGGRWAKIAELLGTPFMPWQRDLADVAGEYDPETGLPYYREVVGVVMRQQGKTTTETAVEVDRCLSWQQPQRVVYSAQTAKDARRKLLDDQVPMIRRSPLAPLIAKPHGQVVAANGNEAVRWKSGSRIELMASLEASGHGFTVNLGLIDEAWKDEDERREQALRPAMLTIPDAQLWVVSTAGNDRSVYLRRKVEAGRASTAEDRGAGICYVEYSVPDDVDVFKAPRVVDLDVMLRYMPALCFTPGPCECSPDWRHTVTHEVLAAEMEGMDPDEARRAYGNQWIAGGGETVIDPGLWDAVQDPSARPDGRIRVAIEVNDDRASAALASSDGTAVECIDHRAGTGWLHDAAKAVKQAHPSVELVVDGNGPAVPVADDLEADGVDVTRLSSGEVVAACGRMFDAVADGKVKVRPHRSFDEAVEGLAKKPLGDRFAWSRAASSSDITPFYAATLAYGPHPPEPETYAFYA